MANKKLAALIEEYSVTLNPAEKQAVAEGKKTLRFPWIQKCEYLYGTTVSVPVVIYPTVVI